MKSEKIQEEESEKISPSPSPLPSPHSPNTFSTFMYNKMILVYTLMMESTSRRGRREWGEHSFIHAVLAEDELMD